MAKLDDIRKRMLTEDEGALEVVDSQSGLPLPVAHNVPYFTHTFTDAAAVAVEIFRGRTVTTVKKLIGNQRGTPVQRWINEIQMTTAATYHFMTVVPGKPNALIVMIASKQPLVWVAKRCATLCQKFPLCAPDDLGSRRREGSRDQFRCLHCGLSQPADLQAANNVQRLGVAGVYGLR